jgi:phosphoserine phosphatase RsbU/P
MSGMQQTDRRRGERLFVDPPLPARLGGARVAVHEIGLFGCLVEHESPLDGVRGRLSIPWNGAVITVDCTVVRSELSNDHSRTGLSFETAAIELQPVIASLAAREEIERLRKIVEASKLINSSIDAESLFDSILDVARGELDVERGTLYFVDEAAEEIWSKIADDLDTKEIRLPVGRGLAGTVAESGEAIILHDAYADPRFDQTQDQRSGFRTRSMLCVPIHNRQRRVVGVLQLLNKRHGSFGPRDLDFLDAISEHMAIAMENATFHLALIEKNRMERELQLGREIQARLLAKPPSDLVGAQLDATSLPCYEVGGDYYDFIELANGDLGIAIGDVSGKGVSAALIMSSLQAALRVAAPLESDLAALIARLNGLLYRMAGGRKYVTFFFGRYTPSTGVMRYVNAGHNPPFLIDPAREGDQAVAMIATTGRPIGILADASYEERELALAPGGTLFLFTDGLNEAANEEEEEFGNERLRELVLRAARRPLPEVAPQVLAEVRAFENGVHATDDKTVVVLRRG